MPVKHNVLTLHSSANQGKDGDVTVFFGLSGTGKTTLSADHNRRLIGDDEHCWSDKGVFNIEGGCYAKCIGLSAEKEPDIYNAIKFGSILENVVFDPVTRDVDYEDTTLTENTRCAYPIEYIDNTKIPCISDGHPTNIILLTCDARGVLPPISKLNTEQTMYHFISGYTSKMAGTEMGITEPQATFSSCFAQPFLALHPMRYAKMLAEKISQHNANAWLLNTGWVGAGATTGGKRCPLTYTRAILDAIHSGELAKVCSSSIFDLLLPVLTFPRSSMRHTKCLICLCQKHVPVCLMSCSTLPRHGIQRVLTLRRKSLSSVSSSRRTSKSMSPRQHPRSRLVDPRYRIGKRR
jgi:phosphoenolpyruvate carboxykinase (ATP)